VNAVPGELAASYTRMSNAELMKLIREGAAS